MTLMFLVFITTVAGVVPEGKEKSWITLISTYINLPYQLHPDWLVLYPSGLRSTSADSEITLV